MELPDEYYEAQVNDAYRAIGRYVVAFSRLTAEMRWLVTKYVAGGDKMVLMDIVLGEAQAAQLSHAFFGLCRDAADFSDAELEIESQLRREVEDEIIPTRNDFSHGDWEVGMVKVNIGGEIEAEVVPPQLKRITPHQKAGSYTVRQITVREMDAMTDRLLEVLAMVVEFGNLALGLGVIKRTPDGGGAVVRGEFRVQDVFEVPDSTKSRETTTPRKAQKRSTRAKVTRTGPRAEELGRLLYTT